jgi:DNA-binding CsgD family transcriptional regulator/tetratricopeptide (TPR) repeat protein
MQGRDREQEIALGFVRDGRSGGGILLIEGEPGSGKSGLLRAAIDEAARQGFSLVASTADELGRAVPFAPLLAALPESRGPRRDGAGHAKTADLGSWLVARFRDRLEQRASDHPVLVSLDDLHWADRATLAALRALPSQLAGYPLLWQLARSTAAPGGGAALLFDLLERDGATRVTLGPLSDAAVAAVIADTLQATPDAELIKLAAGAAGNPYLLVELLTGLREEDAVRVARGRATLVSAQLPDRVQLAVRSWLAELNRQVRPLLETAAVLGRSFRLDDVAEMLGEAPAALLPVVNEALQAGLLAAGTDDFSFRHGLVWQAVTESVPPPARLALHRQFGGILLARGGSAVAAGAHLLASARPGDTAAIAGLDQAAAAALGTAPSTAADLALRALELTAPADPARLQRSAQAAESLTAAGRLADAGDIARVALAQPLPAPAAAPLRCAMSAILAADGHPDQADAMAESVLATPGLTSRLRDEAMITQLRARAVLRDTVRSRSLAEAILATPDRHSVAAVAGAQLVLAAISWDDGWASRGLGHTRSAVRRISGISPDARHFQPLLTLAAMLVDLRMLDEASAVIQAAAGDDQALRSSGTEPVPGILRARVDLALGRTDAAASAAEAALRSARAQSLPLHCSVALSVLGTVALRRGDLRAAAGHLRSRRSYPPPAGWYARTATLLTEAQVAEAAAGPAAAMELAGPIYRELPGRRGVLIGEPSAPAWLARTALAAGQDDRAADVARIADEIARLNPVLKIAATAAAHCRGIVSRDPARLAQAVAEHPDPWARASAAEDLAALLAADGDRAGSISHLDQAAGGYSLASATRDAARVRRRLRRLGVRRRHWAPGGSPATGWDSLTETERAISALVSEGLSNQQVAQQMYLSVHTVAAHLRQVFRKLGIGSRVELTRLAIEAGQRRDHGHPVPPNWRPGRTRQHHQRRDRLAAGSAPGPGPEHQGVRGTAAPTPPPSQ